MGGGEKESKKALAAALALKFLRGKENVPKGRSYKKMNRIHGANVPLNFPLVKGKLLGAQELGLRLRRSLFLFLLFLFFRRTGIRKCFFGEGSTRR